MLKKMASKSIALALAGTFMMTPLFNMASAMEKEGVEGHQEMVTENHGESTDLDEKGIRNHGELIELDGVIYKYEDSLDQDENKITKITNTSTGKEDILTFVDDEILLNDESFATIETTMEAESPTPLKMNEWISTGTYHKTIKWASNGEGYLVLAVVAQALTLKASLVRAAVGIGVFNSIASYCHNGTLHFSTWYYVSLLATLHRYDWSFKASSGKRWGTYQVQFTEY